MAAALALPTVAQASDCDAPGAQWLACEDFEGGELGWSGWYDQSIFVECNGCTDGTNDPARVQLTDAEAHDGAWSLHLPAEASAGFTGASMTYRDCASDPAQAGCQLTGHEQLHFRTWVRLAEDHQYVHHFLSVSGTQPDEYWGADGNAGCRPNGYRAAGTTLDFNENHELFFYTYFPGMNCDAGGYCSGQYVQDICDGCATKDMPCNNGLECCWGNLFSSDPPRVLPVGEWVCLEIMMRLNTPGEADGEMAFWMNDELGHQETGMQWRDVPELQLNKAWLQHYIAGGDADQSNRVWFDDVVVSTERIGCSASEPPGSDESGPNAEGGDSAGDGTGGGDGTGSGGNASSAGDGGQTSAASDDGATLVPEEAPVDGGCGCRTPATPPASALCLLALFARRRRATTGARRSSTSWRRRV